MRPWFCVFVLPLVACGYSHTGQGTGGLRVEGLIDFSTASGQSEATFFVYDAGTLVTDGEVVLIADDDEHTISAPDGTGAFTTRIDGFHRYWEVRIESGDDDLWVRLEGPGPHTLVTPAHEAQIQSDATESFPIAWHASDGFIADKIVMVIDGLCGEETLVDTGGYTMTCDPAVGSPSLELRVGRANLIVPAGGAGGSELEVRYTSHTTLLVQ